MLNTRFPAVVGALFNVIAVAFTTVEIVVFAASTEPPDSLAMVIPGTRPAVLATRTVVFDRATFAEAPIPTRPKVNEPLALGAEVTVKAVAFVIVAIVVLARVPVPPNWKIL
jgi:hypothetical protein